MSQIRVSDGLCDNDVLEVDGIDIGGGCPRSGELWCGGTCCVVMCGPRRGCRRQRLPYSSMVEAQATTQEE